MEKLNALFECKYETSQEAIEHCQLLALCSGFNTRIRTSKERTIYIVCSREGSPEYLNKLDRRRSRFSDRCRCKWRVVLYNNVHLNPNSKWEFRAGKTMTHNHSLLTTIDYKSNNSKLLKLHGFNPKPQVPPEELTLPSIHTILQSCSMNLFNSYPKPQQPIDIFAKYHSSSIESLNSIEKAPYYRDKTLSKDRLVCFSANNDFNGLPIQSFKDFINIISKK